ncbi:MAG: hypothetical protein K0Q74_542, partial [Gammaproteobacteria bacterium]|nr:hypothetical protein [Gammaproteobacteria bacterium]
LFLKFIPTDKSIDRFTSFNDGLDIIASEKKYFAIWEVLFQQVRHGQRENNIADIISSAQ